VRKMASYSTASSRKKLSLLAGRRYRNITNEHDTHYTRTYKTHVNVMYLRFFHVQCPRDVVGFPELSLEIFFTFFGHFRQIGIFYKCKWNNGSVVAVNGSQKEREGLFCQ